MRIPRLVVTGLSGGAGKTLVSLGLARAVSNSGISVRAFKKGPDYIDAAWLSRASRSPQANLDPFFTPGPLLGALFAKAAAGYEMALVEGNRGLFDGLDIAGSCSTAEVARILQAPLLLVLDCTKMTRTAAALVQGCLNFEEGLRIGGVILNRTGNPRHQAMVRRAVEELCGVPVLGVLPRTPHMDIPERHMGLAGIDEYSQADAHLERLAYFVAAHVDLGGIRRMAESAPDIPAPRDDVPEETPVSILSKPSEPDVGSAHARQDLANTDTKGCGRLSLVGPDGSDSATRIAPGPGEWGSDSAPLSGIMKIAGPRSGVVTADCRSERQSARPVSGERRPLLGYVHDSAFWFYYRENLDALEAAGADLRPVSLLDSAPWPELHGLYIGGGVPELHAEALGANAERRARVAALSRSGLPIYAECGGFMYLADHLLLDGRRYPMAGIFHCSVEFCSKPQGLGYVTGTIVEDNPYHPTGYALRGHEFHFSRFVPQGDTPQRHILRLSKGSGMAGGSDGSALDGMLEKLTYASYTHIYAPAAPHWASSFVALCRERLDSGR